MALTKVSAGVLNIDDLYGFRNRLINGDMRINQRGNTSYTVASGSNLYTLDRWEAVDAHANAAYTVGASSDFPAGSGFSNSAIVTITTSGTTGAGDVAIFRQTIEASNVEDLEFGTSTAKTVSLSFWVKGSVTGTYAVAVSNSANNRHYIRHYTISSANTWEYKTVTIPGDTTGTWLRGTSAGLRLKFTLAAGTTYQGTVNTWNAADVIGTSSSVNLTSTNGATWQVTGVQLEVGSVATPFERRPTGLELALCQRYFTAFVADGGIDNYAPLAIGRWYEGTSAQFFFTMPTQMRYPPTLDATSTTAVGTFAVNTGGTFSAVVITGMSLNERSYSTATIAIGYSTGGQTAGQATTLYCDNTDFARISFTAEL
jgi:hypothetical protein